MKKKLLIIPMLCLAASPSLQVSAAGTLSMSVQQQKDNTVQGVVVDQNGEPVIGASIRVKGSKHGTVTDLNGKFSSRMPTAPSRCRTSATRRKCSRT